MLHFSINPVLATTLAGCCVLDSINEEFISEEINDERPDLAWMKQVEAVDHMVYEEL